MKINETGLDGCWIIEPKRFEDDRGYFYESFNLIDFQQKTNQIVSFVQDNQSLSNYGVIRGLHAQKEPFAQAKLVRVVRGKVLDVIVDVRENSPTFGQHFSVELSESNHKQLFIPKGFLHGFSVLSEQAIFLYKCDEYYHADQEYGVRFDDIDLQIDWKIPTEEIIISEKDRQLPMFKEVFKL